MSVFAIEVDRSLCTGCGTCARECTKGKVSATLGTGDCGGCLHCYAVCPEGAITVRNGARHDAPAQGSRIGFDALEGFLASQRSTRHFLPDEPSPESLGRLIEAARYTPSGGNRRAHEITVLPMGATRAALLAELTNIYAKRGALLNSALLSMVLRPFVGATTREFLRDPEYGGKIRALLEKLSRGEDPIFYGAPTVLLFHSRVLIPTPREDCVLAAFALSLAAQSAGFGTCFVTLAQNAVNASPRCKKTLGLTPEDAVHAVLLLGRPAVPFLRPHPRPPIPVHQAAEDRAGYHSPFIPSMLQARRRR